MNNKTYESLLIENKALKKEVEELKAQITIPKPQEKLKLIEGLGESRWTEYKLNGKVMYKKKYANLDKVNEIFDLDKKLIEIILSFQTKHKPFNMKFETISDILEVDYPMTQRIVANLKQLNILKGDLDELGGSLLVNIPQLILMMEPVETVAKINLNDKKSPNDAFIDKANLVHKFKFDYTKIDYQNAKSLLTIVCPKHGPFEQRATNHLQGQGCKHCHIEKRYSKNEIPVDEVIEITEVKTRKSRVNADSKKIFVDKSNLVHKFKYDYSSVFYVSSLEKVTIICPIHGKFDQLPKNHVVGTGCPKCGAERRSELLYNKTPKHLLESDNGLSDEFNIFIKKLTNLNK